MALIDQYTVKGQAQKISKQNFIRLMLQKQQHVFSVINLCLISNAEPMLQVEKDSKYQMQSFELFLEKLQIAIELISELQSSETLHSIVTELNVNEALSNFLISDNSKIRMKALALIKIIFEVFSKHFQWRNFQISKVDFVEWLLNMLMIPLQDP